MPLAREERRGDGEDGDRRIAEMVTRVEVTRMQMACIRKRQSGRGKKGAEGLDCWKPKRGSDERGGKRAWREGIVKKRRSGDSGIAGK